MIYLTEKKSSALVSTELAFDAMRHAFIAAVGPGAEGFTVVIAHASDP